MKNRFSLYRINRILKRFCKYFKDSAYSLCTDLEKLENDKILSMKIYFEFVEYKIVLGYPHYIRNLKHVLRKIYYDMKHLCK